MKKYYYLLFLALVAFKTKAQNNDIGCQFNGFIDTYHAIRSQSPNDFLSSRSRLRTELNITKGKSYMFASLNSIYNSILEDQTKIELREAYFQYTDNSWDLKAGRQIVIWGVADGMRIADVISPMDYTEFLARDYDDIRIPVNVFRIKYLKPNYNLELVFVPIPEYFILPMNDKNPWSMTNKSTLTVSTKSDTKPDKKIKNSEYGGRFSFYLSGIDFSISAMHTWNKMPAFQKYMNQAQDTLLMKSFYDNMDMFAVDFSAPLGQFVIRGEGAAYFGELQEISTNKPIRKNTLNALLGIDWYPGFDWNITAQYSLKHISRYSDILVSDKNTNMATLGITKKIFRNTLSLSTFSYVDLNNEGFFNRLSADYSLSDQIHIIAGYDWFHGDKGMFGMYKDNSEYWMKAKFSF